MYYLTASGPADAVYPPATAAGYQPTTQRMMLHLLDQGETLRALLSGTARPVVEPPAQ